MGIKEIFKRKSLEEKLEDYMEEREAVIEHMESRFRGQSTPKDYGETVASILLNLLCQQQSLNQNLMHLTDKVEDLSRSIDNIIRK